MKRINTAIIARCHLRRIVWTTLCILVHLTNNDWQEMSFPIAVPSICSITCSIFFHGGLAFYHSPRVKSNNDSGKCRSDLILITSLIRRCKFWRCALFRTVTNELGWWWLVLLSSRCEMLKHFCKVRCYGTWEKSIKVRFLYFLWLQNRALNEEGKLLYRWFLLSKCWFYFLLRNRIIYSMFIFCIGCQRRAASHAISPTIKTHSGRTAFSEETDHGRNPEYLSV